MSLTVPWFLVSDDPQGTLACGQDSGLCMWWVFIYLILILQVHTVFRVEIKSITQKKIRSSRETFVTQTVNIFIEIDLKPRVIERVSWFIFGQRTEAMTYIEIYFN